VKAEYYKNFALILLGGLMAAGCNLVNITASNPISTGVTVNGVSAPAVSLVVNTFQNLPQSQWITDSSNVAYTSTSTLMFGGTCSRGIAAVDIYIGGTLAGTSPCGFSGTFSWTNTSTTGDGTYTVRVTPVAGDQKEYTGADWSQSITVDTVAPAAPIITSPTATVTNSSAVTIAGTVSSTNTFKIVSSVPPTSASFSYPGFSDNFTMTPEETTTFTFYAQSRAGLTSPGTSITICYLASAVLSAFDTTGAAITTSVLDSNGSGKMFSSISSTPYLMSTEPMISSDSHLLITGFYNYVY